MSRLQQRCIGSVVVVVLILMGHVPSAAAQTRAAAGPRLTVVVAEPKLAPSITKAVAKSLERAVGEALSKAGAAAADSERVSREMKRLSLPHVASRANATRVASAIDAEAVLHYQARLLGPKIQLRVAVYFIGSGKAVMIERAMLLQELGPNADAMVAELLPARRPTTPPPAASAPAARPAAEAAAGPATAPASRGSVAAPGAINPNAGRGIVFRANFGGSLPIGTNSKDLGVGYRVGGDLGYQIRLGRLQAITPQLAGSFARWGITDLEGAVDVVVAMVGARYDLCLGPVMLWSALHFGFGVASIELQDYGIDESAAAFAVGFNFGVQYMLHPAFGAGLFFDVTRAFVGQIEGEDVSAGGFTFGLALATKIPF